jgi:hypothetical protein
MKIDARRTEKCPPGILFESIPMFQALAKAFRDLGFWAGVPSRRSLPVWTRVASFQSVGREFRRIAKLSGLAVRREFPKVRSGFELA